MVVEEDDAEEGLVEGEEGLARVETLSVVMEITNIHHTMRVSTKMGYLGCMYVIVQTRYLMKRMYTTHSS